MMSSKKLQGSLTEKTLSTEEQQAKVLFEYGFQFIVSVFIYQKNLFVYVFT